MKNIHLYFLLFVSSYSFACSDILDTEMRVLDSSDTVNLCEYEDQVVMVVNVASRCGYTYQYASLQNLYEEYKGEGFVVLGVPSRWDAKYYKTFTFILFIKILERCILVCIATSTCNVYNHNNLIFIFA